MNKHSPCHQTHCTQINKTGDVIMMFVCRHNEAVKPNTATEKWETSWPYFGVKLRKKIAYSYLKVTYCYPNVNYSGLKVTYS